jgi:hypothetical protein
LIGIALGTLLTGLRVLFGVDRPYGELGMAELRCPNCGRNNSDLLDVCQFCQTPLKPESVLRSGEKPTKKNTGELESVLPDWLKDVRQQAKDAAEEDAAQAAANPRPQKNEPPDLLAGLASQAGSAEEEDVPDWLASINPEARQKPSAPSAPEPGADFFAQFNQKESKPEPVSETPPQDAQEHGPSWMSGMRDQSPAPTEKDELSEWFTQASGRSEESTGSDDDQSNLGWGSSFDSPSISAEKPPPKEEEDLSWLHNLEAAAKQTETFKLLKAKRTGQQILKRRLLHKLPLPADLSWLDRLGGIEDLPASTRPDRARDDLSWLNQFGGIPESPQTSQPAAPHAASQQDLSWLNDVGAPSEPQPVDATLNQPLSPQPFAAKEDLDWLNKLGGASEPGQPAQAFSAAEAKQSSEDDLSWLNNLGKPAQPSEPAAPHAASQQDLRWLSELGGEHEPLAAPPFDQGETERVSPGRLLHSIRKRWRKMNLTG